MKTITIPYDYYLELVRYKDKLEYYERLDEVITLENLGYAEREETSSMFCIKSYINNNTNDLIYFDNDKNIEIHNCVLNYVLLQAVINECKKLFDNYSFEGSEK